MRLFVLFFSFLVVSTAQPIITIRSGPIPNIKNFGEVEAGVLYRGSQPTPTGFLELKRFGVKTVIDLRGDKTVGREKIVVESLNMKFINFPMNGILAPKNAEVTRVLGSIILSDYPVYLHCQHGEDRTGTVVAIWRIDVDQWSNKDALAEAKSYKINPLQLFMKHYITHYISLDFD
jgi:tyrosine-protein phosphatase SIW14